jgi:ERCC4-related helicase
LHVEKAGKPIDTEWIEEKPWGSGSFVQWKNPYALCIFDEVHRCGGETTKNSKALIAARRQHGHVLALSATAADDPRQMKALGFLLGLHNLKDYRNWLLRNGCVPGVFGGFDLTEDTEQLDKIFSRLNTNIFPSRGRRLRKSEIPNFPKTQIEPLLLHDRTERAPAVAAAWEAERAKRKATAEDESDEMSNMEQMHRIHQELEMLAIPSWIELAQEYAQNSKVVFFVNYKATLLKLRNDLQKKGLTVGWADGDQSMQERADMIEAFRADTLHAFVANSQTLGESGGLHGKAPRTTFIVPCESGRRLKQIFGRVNREGGDFSLQFLCYFAKTPQEDRYHRLKQKEINIDKLNDASLFDTPNKLA